MLLLFALLLVLKLSPISCVVIFGDRCSNSIMPFCIVCVFRQQVLPVVLCGPEKQM